MNNFRKISEKKLYFREWKAEKPKAVFICMHGLGSHSGCWQDVAEYFLQKNISSYAFDFQGFGKTEGLKGHINGFDNLFEQTVQIWRLVKKENKGKKIFLVSESMGALIAFLFVSRVPKMFDGLVAFSPAFKSRLKFSLVHQLFIFIASFMQPKKMFQLPFNSSMLTTDIEKQKRIDGDSLNVWEASGKLLRTVLFAQIQSGFFAKNVLIPTQFLVAEDDQLVDPITSRRIFEKLKIEDKELLVYPNEKHALTFAKDTNKVCSDLWKWLERRI